jgi:predicted AAA+ superfamily ATPase
LDGTLINTSILEVIRGAAHLIDNEQRWKDYVRDSLIETTISKDILMLTRIDKPALMRQLFELGCVYSGQIISLTKIMGQLQDAGNTTTLTNYLNMLNDCGLLSGLNNMQAIQSGREPPSRSSRFTIMLL